MTEQQSRDFMIALGAEINSWRKRRGLTRSALGAKVDLSETTIGRIERGEAAAAAAASDVWRIAAALGLSLSDLTRRAEDALDLSGPSATTDPVRHDIAVAASDLENFADRYEEPDTP